MEFSQETAAIIDRTRNYAMKNQYEYIMPEMLLLSMCDDATFADAFTECDGDVEVLREDLEGYIQRNCEKSSDGKLELTIAMQNVLALGAHSAMNSSNNVICMRHLLHGIWQLEECYAVYFMMHQGITEEELLREIAFLEDEETDFADEEMEIETDEEMEIETDEEDGDDREYETYGYGDTRRKNRKTSGKKSKSGSKSWMDWAPCMNDALEDVNPLIGREDELERTIQILCRNDKNNPLHIGEPGVGKTALTYGLVQRIEEGSVPEALKGSRVFALDLGGLLAGTQYRGDFEKRLKKVMEGLEREEKPILYLDEIHNIAGAGRVEGGSMDAGNMLKKYLSAGHIRFIGATTFEEYKKHFEKNKSLVRRFQNVEIAEPSEEETVTILKGLAPSYEAFHGVTYEDGVLEYAVSMSKKHINERFLPDKAIDLIDEAGAYRKLHPGEGADGLVVDKEVVAKVLTKICRIPVETVDSEKTEGLADLEERIKQKVFGQDEAVLNVVNAIKFSRAGLLEDDKPLASLLFVGPTGVGKTEVARVLAQQLGAKLVRFDMSEYAEKHAVAKLIGSPAGYVGYEEGGLLTEEIRKNPSAVLLLDEIEKAHSDIYNILLQVMDYATLTDNQGRKADFRNVVIIMTSNAGASRLGKPGIGFTSESADRGVLTEEIKRTFQPEFRNRLNKIVYFNGMDDEMGTLVVDKKLGELADLLEKKGIAFEADKSAKDAIKKKGISAEFGAREVDRVIRNEIKPLFVDEILFGKLTGGGKVTLTAEDEEFGVSIMEVEA